jgi:hypothetical protein
MPRSRVMYMVVILIIGLRALSSYIFCCCWISRHIYNYIQHSTVLADSNKGIFMRSINHVVPDLDACRQIK